MPHHAQPNPAEFELQRLRERDAHKLADLHALCFAGQSAWSAGTFASLLAQETCRGFVIGDSDRMRGFALFQGVEPEVELLTLCSHPNHRRVGEAKRVMQASERALQSEGMERIFLEVSEANQPAINLYQTLGFVCLSTRKAYYSGPDGEFDALIMAKEIAGQAEAKGPSSSHGPT